MVGAGDETWVSWGSASKPEGVPFQYSQFGPKERNEAKPETLEP